jgi:hypothetical protein
MLYNPQIGDIVYPNYTPVNAGKIIKIEDPGFYPDGRKKGASDSKCTILKANGQEYTELAAHLVYFECLVESHERKAKNQRAILEKLKSM